MPNDSAKAFPCPNCGRPLGLSPALDGRRLRCRTCGSILSLAVQVPPRGRRRGTMIVRLVSADEPCPRCSAPLHLVPALKKKRIRCRGCQTLLAVSVRPWRLSPVSEAEPSDAAAEPIAEPQVTETPGPEVAPLPETVPSPPRKPSAGVPAAEAGPFNRHAIDEPRRRPVTLGIGLLAVILVALAAGAWRLLPSRRMHPEARYLPENCQRFVSIRGSLLCRTEVNATDSEAPGLVPIQRCRIFLANAAIEAADVERINVGVDAEGEGTVLVYRLTRPVRGEAILERAPFRDPQKRARPSETVGGVVLYSLGRTGLAFPNPQTILNGETDLLRKTLARYGSGLGDPLNRLLGTLDFSAPVVTASVGVGEPVQSLLQRSGVKSEAIAGTTDSFQPGPTVALLCVLHLRDPRSAKSVAAALRTALREAAEDPKTAPPVRRLLAGGSASAADGKVQVQWSAQGDLASAQPLVLLKPLFY